MPTAQEVSAARSTTPLVCFLFPAFYVVTLGPAMLQFLRASSDGLMPALK